MPLISFPQAFALNKGANYAFNATFAGLAVSTLTAPAGYKFDQPAFQTPAANLYNSASTTYTIAGLNAAHTASVLKDGGNLVDTAIKWTNGKSLGNWYQIQRHASTSTGGSVTSNGKVLRVTCGNTTSMLNRSLLHDVKFNRNNVLITENSGTVNGYLELTDNVNTKLYFKGYVEYFDINENSSVEVGLKVANHTHFFVGYRYFHTQNIYGTDSTFPLPIYTGTSRGFGFLPVRLNDTTFTWHCVVIAQVDAASSEQTIGFCYVVNTNLNAFASHKLEVSFDNGTITWFANGTQVATTTIASLISQGHTFNAVNNAMYAGIASIKGGLEITVPGQFTICVEEAAVIRELPLTYNNFEDTETEVTASEIDYHNTGLRLLKKLK